MKIQNLSIENENLQKTLEEKDIEIKNLKSKMLQLQKKKKSNKYEPISNKKTIEDHKFSKLIILDSEAINDLKTIKIIGNGGSGIVYKVSYMKKIYAHKVLNQISLENFKIMLNEYEILSFLDHPNALKTYGIFMGDETLPPSILLEHCCKDIGCAIKEKSLSNVEINFSIYQIVEALKYIHFRKIIHRDLKPTNILIDNNRTIKICDFGLSKYVDPNESHLSMTKCLGSLFFMAPEILNETDNYNEKIDIYSFGVLIFFILNKGKMPQISIPQIAAGKMAPIPTTLSKFSINLIKSCWNFDPMKRPSFKQILNELEKHQFQLVDLSYKEMNELKTLINKHKTRIPRYD